MDSDHGHNRLKTFASIALLIIHLLKPEGNTFGQLLKQCPFHFITTSHFEILLRVFEIGCIWNLDFCPSVLHKFPLVLCFASFFTCKNNKRCKLNRSLNSVCEFFCNCVRRLASNAGVSISAYIYLYSVRNWIHLLWCLHPKFTLYWVPNIVGVIHWLYLKY